MSGLILDCAGKALDLGRPRIMGVLNITPDSFSDGGRYLDPEVALSHARKMVAEGADIIDVGGESTRPGAVRVSVEDEIARVVPVIARLSAELPVPVSVDTSKASVMQAAIEAGAGLINDVRALQEKDAVDVAARSGLPVCLMHMQGEPGSMQSEPHYDDVVEDVLEFLQHRIAACEVVGINRDRILVDPGIGFGKTLEHNLALLAAIKRFKSLSAGILVGVSRKSMFGKLLDLPLDERMLPSVVTATLMAWQGVSILRVHDVRETRLALELCQALRGCHE